MNDLKFFIDKIIDGKMSEKQFNSSDITFSEIEIVKKVLYKKIWHREAVNGHRRKERNQYHGSAKPQSAKVHKYVYGRQVRFLTGTFFKVRPTLKL